MRNFQIVMPDGSKYDPAAATTGPRVTSGKGTSKQDYETPPEFISAVGRRFGDIAWDLAASMSNAVVDGFYSEEDSAFHHSWHELPAGLLWLNPPFSAITPWAFRCLVEATMGAEIAFLTPASVGANWMRDKVLGVADVYLLSGRLTFVGCDDPYPKDCALSHFGPKATGRVLVWDWERDRIVHEWRKR